MTAMRELWLRLLSFLQKRNRDRELDDEIAAHIGLATDEHIRRGANPAEARRLALAEFGSREAAKELHRDTRGLPWLDGIAQDARYAARTLRRSPDFALTAVVTLAVGIGVNATVFTVTNAVLFKGFPLVEANDRLVYISSTPGCCVSYPDFADWRQQATSFSGMALVHGFGIVLSDDVGATERYDATEITSATLELVGGKPILGRIFAASDEIPGAPRVVILTYGLWQRRYSGDTSIVGRTVRIDGAPTTIIGVMPDGFLFPQKQDVWMPLVRTAAMEDRGNRNTWFVLGRLNDEATLATARAEMKAIGARLAAAYPETNEKYAAPFVEDFNGFFIGSDESWIYAAMWGAVGFVLLIACANLANLMLARAAGRSREIATRVALGAGRWRILRQLLIESVALSSAGGLLGWWIAKGGVRLYELANRGPGFYTWRLLDYSLDAPVLWYLAAISVGTGIVFGLAPALRLSQLDGNTAWRGGSRGVVGGVGHQKLASLLVTFEMALAVVLLSAAGVMIRSLMNVSSADLGVRTDQVITAQLQLAGHGYDAPQEKLAFYDGLLDRVRSAPGVESAAMSSDLPAWKVGFTSYEAEGLKGAEQGRRASPIIVSPSYFRTMGVRLLAGRQFNAADGPAATPVAIINQRLAEQQWPGEEALGKRLRIFVDLGTEPWLTVVGVVSNVVQADGTRRDFEPLVYLPFSQKPSDHMWLLARTSVDPTSITAALRDAVRALDAELPIWEGPYPLDNRIAENAWDKELYGAMFMLFAAIALLLASSGLYAVIAHVVSQRTQEIGLRMAVGATPRDIVRLVLRQGLPPLALGLAVGLLASVLVNRAIEAQLVGVSPVDPVNLVAVSAVLVLRAAVGCWIPARRALRVEPVDALRHD